MRLNLIVVQQWINEEECIGPTPNFTFPSAYYLFPSLFEFSLEVDINSVYFKIAELHVFPPTFS